MKRRDLLAIAGLVVLGLAFRVPAQGEYASGIFHGFGQGTVTIDDKVFPLDENAKIYAGRKVVSPSVLEPGMPIEYKLRRLPGGQSQVIEIRVLTD